MACWRPQRRPTLCGDPAGPSAPGMKKASGYQLFPCQVMDVQELLDQ
jgi:hypothetical protein